MENTFSPGVFYHIYNRGINRANIFREPSNYFYFLNLYKQYIPATADTFAYCLLRNHFHLFVYIKASPLTLNTSQQFSNLFNAYSRSFNQRYQRTGALFQRPFQRIAITKNQHYLALIEYIHRNPQKHGFVEDYRTWPYSSYQALIGQKPTFLCRELVRSWGMEIIKQDPLTLPPGIDDILLDDE